MKTRKQLTVTRVARMVVSVIVAVMMVLPNVALVSGYADTRSVVPVQASAALPESGELSLETSNVSQECVSGAECDAPLGLQSLHSEDNPAIMLISRAENECLDVKDWGTEDPDKGDTLQLWDCTGNDNQLWTLLPDGKSGYFQIQSVHNSNKCLDVRDWGEEDGDEVFQYTCQTRGWPWSKDNQLWRPEIVGGGYYRLVSKHSGLCLDVDRSSGKIQQWDCWGGENQQWQTIAVNVDDIIVAQHSNQCLDLREEPPDPKAIQQWSCHSRANQRWILHPIRGNSYFEIVSEQSGQCMDVQDKSTEPGAAIIQWDCWGGDNQAWRLVPLGNGYVHFKAKHSELCLAVPEASSVKGTQLIQDTCDPEATNQRFSIAAQGEGFPGEPVGSGISIVNNGSVYIAAVNLTVPGVELTTIQEHVSENPEAFPPSASSYYIRTALPDLVATRISNDSPFAAINGIGFDCSLPYWETFMLARPTALSTLKDPFTNQGGVVDDEEKNCNNGNTGCVSFFTYDQDNNAHIYRGTKGNSIPGNHNKTKEQIEELLSSMQFGVGYAGTLLYPVNGIPTYIEGSYGSNVRKTAIAVSADSHTVFLATAGSNVSSKAFAEQLIALGAIQAVFLDGGGSSQFYALGNKVSEDVFARNDLGWCYHPTEPPDFEWLPERRWLLNGVLAYSSNMQLDHSWTIEQPLSAARQYALSNEIEVGIAPNTFTTVAAMRANEYAVNSSGDITLNYSPSAAQTVFPLASVGRFYTLQANYADGSPVALQNPYQVKVYYQPESVPCALDETDLALYHWDGQTWQLVPGSQVNPVENYVTATPQTFGLFAVLAADTEPPRSHTIVGCAQPGNDGACLGDVVLTFGGLDMQTGLDKLRFSLEGGAWQEYTMPITLTEEGLWTWQHYATDRGGNEESPQSQQVLIDKTAPVSTLELEPARPKGGAPYTADVHVTLTAADAGDPALASGLGFIEYRLNGGAWLRYAETVPLIITQNGDNILEYRAVDVAGNVEATQRVTVTLDKTVHTLIPLDATQDDYWNAVRFVMDAFFAGQQPLMATQAFSVTQWYGTLGGSTDYLTGTVILPGEVTGNFTKQILVGPLDVPAAQVLYPQLPVIFNSASADERASWEQLEIGNVLENALNRSDWPRVDEQALVSDTLPADVVFIPAGVTPDVQRIFAESGAVEALLAQVQAGRWVVCQGDGCLLVQQAGLVPDGTLAAGDTLPAGNAALAPVDQNALLTYNWPEGMQLARYNDTPRFTLTDDLVRVADYADNGEAAIVQRRLGAGGVILIGGHASADASSYGLLYHALFAAGAEQVGSRVKVEQQFMPGAPPDVLPGLEANMPVLVRSTPTNYGTAPVHDFSYTEFVAPGFYLLAPPTVTVGTVAVTPLTATQGTAILPAGTRLVWTADSLPPGEHELTYLAANVTTDTLKPGAAVIGTAEFSYTAGEAVTRTVYLSRPDAVARALLPGLLVHNLTDEPDNVYPQPAAGFYQHHRTVNANALESRFNNATITTTVPYIDIVRSAHDHNKFARVDWRYYCSPNAWTDLDEIHAFVLNRVSGYPERTYLPPQGASGFDWEYGLENWDGATWVRIPNPYNTHIAIPEEYAQFIIQEFDEQGVPGDLLVPGVTLVFDVGTLLAYDNLDPATRYRIHSQELFGRGISFNVAPVDGTLVLDGNGGSVYTAVGQHPIPFREYFPDAAINNPIAPVPSEITYTDLWGRAHTLTETVRSSYYDIIPYPKTGDAVSVRAVDVYGIEGERGDRLYDVAAAQTLTVTYVVKAQSVNRTLAQEQFFIQKLLPRGLGYDIEFLSWASSNGSFVLLDEYSLQFPAFELLSFQGALPENESQVITITARLRTYPDYLREGSFLVDGGSRYAAPVEFGAPGHYDTGMTHVRVEQGYAANPEIIKRVAEAQVQRQGGTAHEIININALADIQRYWEETYVDSVGTLDKAATVRVGGSWGPNLYFATVAPGGETLLVHEIVNAEGVDWSNVALDYVAPPGITLTPLFTDGVEPPPNVYDTPYLWADEIPDIGRGVYYYKVHVDESVAPGVMYPIVFTLTGDNVPDATALPLPVARVGVGGDARYILGQTTAEQVLDRSPEYVTPVTAALATAEQIAATTEYTETEQWADFFATLTRPVPFTYTVQPGGERLITYTIPAEWQTLPQQHEATLNGEWYLLVQSTITATEPGYRVVNYGPQLEGVDSFNVPLTVMGNPGHTTVSGPALTGTYRLLTVTSPFYGGMVIDPLPGEVVEAWIDIAIINVGNRIALSPEISATVNLTGGMEIVDIIPAPTSVISGVITWQLDDILPYGGLGDPELDTEHVRVQVRFTPPDTQETRARLARLENMPFYVPLLEKSDARYAYTWGEQTFTVNSPLGAAYGLHVGADPLPAPTLIRATWDAVRQRVLLEWTTITGASDYVVYRSTQPDRDFRQIGLVTSGATMEDMMTDGPLAPVYYYVVRARDATLAEGRHSPVVTVYTGRTSQVYLPLVLRR